MKTYDKFEQTNLMQTYLKEINNVPLLSREEEFELAMRAKRAICRRARS